jgi:hypothetical protein
MAESVSLLEIQRMRSRGWDSEEMVQTPRGNCSINTHRPNYATCQETWYEIRSTSGVPFDTHQRLLEEHAWCNSSRRNGREASLHPSAAVVFKYSQPKGKERNERVTQVEDEVIIKAMKLDGCPSWATIEAHVGITNPRQCKLFDQRLR